MSAAIVAFTVVAALLVATVIVGMRVSWVPLRDTAVHIGLGEVRSWYPLSIDGLDGVAIIAAITLYGRKGYAAAMGTVVGLTALSTILNVAHGLEHADVTAESAWTTWAIVILGAAAPNACIALGAHLVAVMLQRVRGLLDVWLAQRATRAPKAVKVERRRAKVEPPAEPIRVGNEAESSLDDVADTHDHADDHADDPTPEPEARPTSAEPVRKRYLLAREAAELIGVHRATVDTWVREGQLPVAAKHEMGWRLYDADLVRTLSSNSN